ARLEIILAELTDKARSGSWSVIRKSMLSGHDPMGGYCFARDKREAFAGRSCSNINPECFRNSDSALENQPTVDHQGLADVVGRVALVRMIGGRRTDDDERPLRCT